MLKHHGPDSELPPDATVVLTRTVDRKYPELFPGVALNVAVSSFQDRTSNTSLMLKPDEYRWQ